MPEATVSNVNAITPENLRNSMMETVDQMERLEMGGTGVYASAASEFPLVNLDNPTESYFTFDGVTGRMRPTAYDAESPIGTIDLPQKEEITVESYKRKLNPKKGVETAASEIPYSAFARAATKLNQKIFLTREQIAWRGDEAIDGLIGQQGNSAHPDIPADNVVTVGTAWSDEVNATPYSDITDVAFDIVNNGYMGGGGQVTPNIYMGPQTLRDLKQSDDMEGKLPSTNYQIVNTEALNAIIGEDINDIKVVMVYMPREDANGNYLDANGNVVDDADDAALDNILEPWDPAANAGAGGTHRNVVVGRPGAGSAFFPWFLDRLLEYEGDVPGDIAVDQNNGFFTQVWNSADPIATYFAAKQELGFVIQRGENWAVLRDV